MEQAKDRSSFTWLAIGVIFVALWVLYLAFFGPRGRPPRLEDSGTSQPASYDWTLLDLNDRTTSFARFKGKAVFLNIWATWCGPCVQEMPSIARLAEDPQLRGKGIEFVCVSTDESTEAVRRFLEGRGWTMSFLRAEKFPSVFLTEVIPATFIIAPDGRIVAREFGSARWDTPDVVALLTKLTAEPARSP
jgi:thiol-disulfide isomerase/thioredoxin